MINNSLRFNINAPLSTIFIGSDSTMRRIYRDLYSNQVVTVRDLVRLKTDDLLLLSYITDEQFWEIRNLLLQNNMDFGMDFNVMEELIDNANIDVIGAKAAKRREKELIEAGNANAHDIAQEELQSGQLRLNDEEATEWLTMGMTFIDEELRLRAEWKQKMESIRNISSNRPKKDENRFSLRNIKKYILHKFGLINMSVK